MDEKEIGTLSSILADFSTRMNDLEEKNRLLRERLMLVSQTVLKQSERVNKEIVLIKEDIRTLQNDFDRLKEVVDHIVRDSSDFARRDELKVLERYMKMFEPLKFTTTEEVKKLIKKALKEKRK